MKLFDQGGKSYGQTVYRGHHLLRRSLLRRASSWWAWGGHDRATVEPGQDATAVRNQAALDAVENSRHIIAFAVVGLVFFGSRTGLLPGTPAKRSPPAHPLTPASCRPKSARSAFRGRNFKPAKRDGFCGEHPCLSGPSRL